MANNCNKTFRELLASGQAQVLGIVSEVPMGDWNADTEYQKLNFVRHNGATYKAKAPNKNIEPGVAEGWENTWMLCTIDGITTPGGTYPDMTVGTAYVAEKAIADEAGNNIQDTYATKQALSEEVSRAEAAEQALQSDITAEATARQQADTALGQRIDDIVSGTTEVGHATVAEKLSTDAGSSTNPVYFDNGVPVVTGATLDKNISGTAAKATADASGNTIATFYGHSISMSINSSTYVVTLSLLDASGTALNTETIDLPLESVVVSGAYDEATKEVVLTLQNGSEVRFSVADLVDGLASQSALTAETQARQQADNTLQSDITAEATARQQADTALGQRIDNVINGTTPVEKAESANDPNAVHFTAQTLTEAQQLQARTNISAAAEEQALKNLYNLGAYDTFVDNGNGTATITRKTGYIYLDPNIYSGWAKNDSGTAVVWIANGLYAGAADVAAGAAEVRCNTFKSLSPWTATNTYSIQVGIYSDGRVAIEISLNQSSAETVADVVRYLSVHPTYIQHLSATSYTEDVILDQPIHTIDQHGEQWLRDEWGKGLNLTEVTFTGTGQYGHAYRVTRDIFKPNNIYTISFDTKNTGAKIYFNETIFYGETIAGVGDLDVTANGTHKYLTVQCRSSISNELVLAKNRTNNVDTNADGSSFYNWMIVEGNGLYPYLPYNGDIIRQKDIENVYSPDNPPPYPVTSVNGKTGAISSNDVIGYYNIDPVTWAALQNLPTAFGIKYIGDSDAIVQFSNSLHKTHLVIDGNIYVNEGQELVASQNWVNSTLGGYVPQTNLSSQAQVDLNELTDAGMYRMGLMVVNGPSSIELAHGQVLVVHGGGDTVAQIAFPYMDTHHVNIRVGNPINSGGTWSEWERIVFADEMTQYALKADIPSDATTTKKGIATLGASGGAARYGQKGDVGLGNVDNVRQYSASNPPPYGTLTFTGAVNDSFSANQDKIINIPTVAGVTPDLTIGTVTTGEPGTDASATITGTSENPVLNLTIPRGEPGAQGQPGQDGAPGEKGETGTTPVITVTATVDNSVGTPDVEVTKGGSTTAPSFAFAFTNLKGAKGDTGADGQDGVTPNISATASVSNTTGTPSVTVTKSGTAANPSFNFAFSNIKGDTGEVGDISASDITSGILPVARGGTGVGNLNSAMADLIQASTASTIGASEYIPAAPASGSTAYRYTFTQLKDWLVSQGLGGGGDVTSVNGQTGAVALDYSDVGAAASEHTHSAADIVSGTISADRLPIIPVTKGGTGVSTLNEAMADFIIAANADNSFQYPELFFIPIASDTTGFSGTSYRCTIGGLGRFILGSIPNRYMHYVSVYMDNSSHDMCMATIMIFSDSSSAITKSTLRNFLGLSTTNKPIGNAFCTVWSSTWNSSAAADVLYMRYSGGLYYANITIYQDGAGRSLSFTDASISVTNDTVITMSYAI